MFTENDEFIKNIVFELIENELYKNYAVLLSEDDRDAIVKAYNAAGLNDCPSITELLSIYNDVFEGDF